MSDQLEIITAEAMQNFLEQSQGVVKDLLDALVLLTVAYEGGSWVPYRNGVLTSWADLETTAPTMAVNGYLVFNNVGRYFGNPGFVSVGPAMKTGTNPYMPFLISAIPTTVYLMGVFGVTAEQEMQTLSDAIRFTMTIYPTH